MEKEKITSGEVKGELVSRNLRDIIDRLRKPVGEQEKKEIIANFFRAIENALEAKGIFIEEDIGEIYKDIFQHAGGLLVRREAIDRVVDLLFLGKGIKISGQEHGGGNSAVVSDEGIKIAMAEGQTDPGIISLMFLSKNNLQIEDCPADPLRPNRQFCRRTTGEISKDNLKYLIFRIPKQYFPQDEVLPEEEEDRFIFRGIDFREFKKSA
ncbi:MAG: hypothetical protein PHD51_04010 [Patescibacteria group bacterium]|nr:hypothetical protein [Patescibacteria group bacterium]MDD5490871.1 hypothetical protein [Patescibacteria group bacterium]